MPIYLFIIHFGVCGHIIMMFLIAQSIYAYRTGDLHGPAWNDVTMCS